MDPRFQRRQSWNDFGRSRAQLRDGMERAVQRAQAQDPAGREAARLRETEQRTMEHPASGGHRTMAQQPLRAFEERRRSRSPARVRLAARRPDERNVGMTIAELPRVHREWIRSLVPQVDMATIVPALPAPSGVNECLRDQARHGHLGMTANAGPSGRLHRPQLGRHHRVPFPWFGNHTPPQWSGDDDNESDDLPMASSSDFHSHMPWPNEERSDVFPSSESEVENLEDAEHGGSDAPQLGLSRDALDACTSVMTLTGTLAATLAQNAGSDSTALECRICLERFQADDRLRLLPCFHRYHSTCIEEWLSRNRLCPLCKHDVTQ